MSEASHAASPARLAKARREGHAPHAPLAAAGGMAIGFLLGAAFAAPVIAHSMVSAATTLAEHSSEGFDLHGAGEPLSAVTVALGGVVLATTAGGLLAGWVSSGWLWSGAAVSLQSARLVPRWGRLGRGALRSLVIAALTTFALAAICWGELRVWAWALPEASDQGAAWLAQAASATLNSLVLTSAGLFALVCMADTLWARWDHMRSWRMSREQLAAEAREDRGVARRASYAVATPPLTPAPDDETVRQASVLVLGTGPSAIAVALGYTPGHDAAPRLLGVATGWQAVRWNAMVNHGRAVVVSDRVLAARLAAQAPGEYIDASAYAPVAAALREGARAERR